MKKLLSRIGNNWPLVAILISAFVLRIFQLTSQSLWLDELHTLNEASPDISWAQLFEYLRCCDQHPPLFFVVERLAYTFFGHTEFVARFISVLAGTASVFAMWLLGREVLNKSLANIVAILTCVNYYNLWYSQEARGYIFAFLFATLSFTYLLKLVKSPGRRNSLLWALFTLGLLYSHYYSLFVVVAEGVFALVILFQEKGADRKRLFINLLIGGIVIAAGYAPWLPYMLTMSEIKSFWISGDISLKFIRDFFVDYFGDTKLLKPLLYALLLFYLVRVFMNMKNNGLKRIQNDPLILSFVMGILWIFITYLIPYVRSILVVPMLITRYTIVVVPAYLLAIAFSIELLKKPIFKYVVIGAFVILSLIDIGLKKGFYTLVRKTQFREMTQLVVQSNPNNYPIINEVTNWHHTYYLNLYKSKATLLPGNKKAMIDSILHKTSAQYNVEGFWIVGAHGETQPDSTLRVSLDTAYSILLEQQFYDAWAQLYIDKKRYDSMYILRYNDFPEKQGTVQEDIKKLVIWGGAIQSKPIARSKGKYRITIAAYGTIAKNVYPHLNIYCNNNKIGDYYTSNFMTQHSFTYDHLQDGDFTIKIDFDNDYGSKREDRNVYLHHIIIEKIQD